MQKMTKWIVIQLSIYMFIGIFSTADVQSSQFSFSDCNEIISEARLTEVLKHHTIYGEDPSDLDTTKKNSKPMELGKPLKKSTDAQHGTANCDFSGPMKGGTGIFAESPLYTGSIRICTSNTKSQFAGFTSKNEDNLETFRQTVLEESTEIGKATIVNKMEIGRAIQSISVKFLDDDTDVFVDVTINEMKSLSGRSKPENPPKSLENVLEKAKNIAREVEKQIK